MKKILLTLITSAAFSFCQAQVICILCFDQNDSISDNVTNLIQNGGFEINNCGAMGYFCPNSQNYTCDLTGWTCTGGGPYTYAHNLQNSLSDIVEGLNGAYMGNYYANACSTAPEDTSCLHDTACATFNLPPGYPTNTVDYGGNTGISLSQTVNGLTIGATYVLEFWAGGEGSFWPDRGLFGVDVGFGDTLLRNKQTSFGSGVPGTRFLVEFVAVATSHTIKFTNWGHICSSCTELVLDDVKLYTLAELNPSVPPCLGLNPIALFSAPNHICPGTCTNFTNTSVNCTSFIWSFPGGTPSVSTDVNPTGICYTSPGTYAVSLIGSNLTTSDTLTLNNYLTVYPYPPPQGILQNGDTLFSNQGAVSYQWFYNSVPITGATDYYYVAMQSGNYNVVATDNNGCEVEAVLNDVIAAVSPLSWDEKSGVRLYPNPVKDELFIDAGKMHTEKLLLSVFNLLGEEMHVAFVNESPLRMDVKNLPSGTYWIEATDGVQTSHSRFFKQ